MPAPNLTITVLSGVRGDTRRYRSIHPYEQLRLAGVDCLLSHVTHPQLSSHIQRSAVVIFHRTTANPFILRLISEVQSRGGLAIQDVDDLVFDPGAFRWIDSPDFADPVRAALYQEDMRRNRAALQACQAVTASTEYLADLARAQDKPAWVHRNAFSLEMLALASTALQNKPPGGEKVIIGYASGTPTHDRDFEHIRPALQTILRRFPQTELWLVGPLDPGPGWEGLPGRLRRFDFVPWRRLPELLVQFDINLAPLVLDNPFSQSKSEIKFMEAALLKVPTIASPTGAFRHAIRPDENGCLATTPQEWEESLAKLVAQPAFRRDLAECACREVHQRYHPYTRAAQLIDTLDQIHAHVRGSSLWEPGRLRQMQATLQPADPLPARFWTHPELERQPTLARMALYNLRYRGLSTLLKQVWITFRRSLAPLFPYRR